MDIVISGIGIVAPCDLKPLVNGPVPARTDWPEITLIDVPEGAPEIASECADFVLANEVPTKYPFIDRCSALAIGAASRALKDAGLSIERTRSETIGLCFGTTWGCLDAMRVFYEKIKEGKPQVASPLPFSHSFANSPSSLLAIEFGLRGFAATYSEGHTAGIAALISAINAISACTADRILVVASDAISHGSFHHYWAENRLAADTAAKQTGKGFVLGEGAAALVLESTAALVARGGHSRGGLRGWSCGANFSQAWKNSGAVAAKVIFLNAPETPAIDAEEAGFVSKVGGADQRSIKAAAGHAMSASALTAVALAAQTSGADSLVAAADELTGAFLIQVAGGPQK